MKPDQSSNQKLTLDLINRYSVMSQKGTVANLQETDFSTLIDYFVARNEMPKALEVLDHAQAQYGSNPTFYYKKAMLLKSINMYEDALHQLERAEIYVSNDMNITLLMAELKAKLNDIDEALFLLDDLKEQVNEKDHYLILYTEALIHESLEDYKAMFSTLKRCVLMNYNYSPALEKIWFCIELTGNYQESIKIHKYITEKDPYNHRAWFNLGHAHMYFGNNEEAIEAFDFAFTIDEKFEFAYRDCAEVCIEIGQYEKALRCYRELLNHVKPDAQLLNRLGLCYVKLGDFNTAKAFLVRVLKEDEKNHEAMYLLGECLIVDKEWEKAMKCFKAAIKEFALNEDYYVGLGKAYHGVDNNVDALLCYQRAVDIAPETSVYWKKYAKFLVKIDQGEQAIHILNEATEYCDEADITYCKVECLYLQGKIHEAIFIFGDALELDFEGHYPILEKYPDLAKNDTVQSMIATYTI
jgi:tetratricopeptide (TPR) repeat protein